MKKVKISAVSYLNTKPFVWGILHSEIYDKIDLSLDMPSLCAAKLKEDVVDIGLIPAAAIPEIEKPQIITDFCISSTGKVRTVILASQVPLSEIKSIVLDYQSRTSVRLVQILANNFWQMSLKWIKGKPDYIQNDIQGTTAGVIIGDRVFEAETKFRYTYDLGEEWQKMTGLDFVYACWVANKTIDSGFISEFNQALMFGQMHLPEVIAEIQCTYPGCNLNEYFRENILYDLDSSRKKGLDLFLKYNENSELI